MKVKGVYADILEKSWHIANENPVKSIKNE